MRIAVVLACTLTAAGVAGAQNLLVNPVFDLDPTNPANGWTILGDGTVEFNTSLGYPAAPSARLSATGAQAVRLEQCVAVDPDVVYGFSAVSHTEQANGNGANSISVQLFTSADCSSGDFESVTTSVETVPEPTWVLRQGQTFLGAQQAHSALISLASIANGDTDVIDFDTVFLPEPAASLTAAVALGAVGTLGLRARRLRPRGRSLLFGDSSSTRCSKRSSGHRPELTPAAR